MLQPRIAFAIAAACASVAVGQTTINGSALAFRSSGSVAGGTVTLNENGYLGTYVRLNAPGAISLTANANGTASNGVSPRLTFAIADATRSFAVTPGSTNAYAYTSPVLPTGTYFVRAQLDNHETLLVNGSPVVANTTLGLASLTVGANATVLNNGSDANARAAADTYIEGFRKGNANVRLLGATPGASVRVRLTDHAFQLGTYVSGGFSSTDSYLRANAPAGSDAAEFQRFIAGRFNSIVPSNAGKWDTTQTVASNGTQTNKIGQGIVDQMMAYADARGMAARQHNVIWGNQQPTQVRTWLQNAANTSLSSTVRAQNVASLKSAIATRIATMIAGTNSVDGKVRAAHFRDLDVLNEAMQTGNYWSVLGPGGVAEVYRQAQEQVAAAGLDTRLYTNEYNVLQNSPITLAPSATYGQQGAATYGDQYANWYRRQVEAINDAGVANGAPGDVVTGVGVQYYPMEGGTRGPNVIQRAMQNLAVAGLPMALTEFGGQTTIADADAPGIVDDAIRMMLGTPGVESMHVWGWYDHDGLNNDMFGDGTSLVNQGWTNPDGSWDLTAAGRRFEYLFGRGLDATAPGANPDGSNPNPWTTDRTLSVAADGTIDFRGFYGTYELTIDGRAYAVTIEKGAATYVVSVPEPAMVAASLAAVAATGRRRRSASAAAEKSATNI